MGEFILRAQNHFCLSPHFEVVGEKVDWLWPQGIMQSSSPQSLVCALLLEQLGALS